MRYLKDAGLDSDLVYLIDRENAPYGIKSEKEILEITEKNIRALAAMGAEKILIACCTASTVYPHLKDEYKRISVPIIEAVANEAKRCTKSGRIAVIATQRTADSHTFGRALDGYDVTELSVGELVAMIDGGLCDESIGENDEKRIEGILAPVFTSGADTLILGCTHFPAIKKAIGRIAARHGAENIIDSAKIGADTLMACQNKEG